MTRRHMPTLGILAILALALGPTASKAELILSHSGTFSATSTLNGVPFGAPTPFTFQAVFDTAATDTDPADGFGVFATIVTFNITGFGIFTSDPAGDVSVLLVDPSGAGTTLYGVGLSNAAMTRGYASFFSTAVPPFDADVPTPSALSGLFSTSTTFPFIVPLSGGVGNLVINGVEPVGATAQISEAIAAVPEPPVDSPRDSTIPASGPRVPLRPAPPRGRRRAGPGDRFRPRSENIRMAKKSP